MQYFAVPSSLPKSLLKCAIATVVVLAVFVIANVVLLLHSECENFISTKIDNFQMQQAVHEADGNIGTFCLYFSKENSC